MALTELSRQRAIDERAKETKKDAPRLTPKFEADAVENEVTALPVDSEEIKTDQPVYPARTKRRHG